MGTSAVSTEEFDLLSLLLCSGSSFSRPFPHLQDAVPGFQGKKSMPYVELKKWVDTSLGWNEEVYSHVEPSLSNSSDVPNTVYVSGLSKTTWFQKSPNNEAKYLNIFSCTDCIIYVTSPLRFC